MCYDNLEEINMNKVEETYLFIKNYIADKGYPPTVREICQGINIKSTSTISYYLKKLEDNNRIVKGSYKNRALQLIDSVSTVQKDSDNDEIANTIQIPVIGTIAAGTPILAEQNHTESVVFSENLFKGTNLFILKVRGDSMVNAGILNGDYVVINKQGIASNGEIIAAMIDGEATVKRFYKENNFFRLQPENSFMDPIYTDHLDILGKVVGVIRNKF